MVRSTSSNSRPDTLAQDQPPQPGLISCNTRLAHTSVPYSDIGHPSFNDLVGERKQRRWHIEAERLGGLEVNRQLVPGRRLNRQVSRFLAFEDAIYVARRAPVLVDRIRSVRAQASASGVVAERVHRGQPVPGRQRQLGPPHLFGEIGREWHDTSFSYSPLMSSCFTSRPNFAKSPLTRREN
jgi:hypothetical protein